MTNVYLFIQKDYLLIVKHIDTFRLHANSDPSIMNMNCVQLVLPKLSISATQQIDSAVSERLTFLENY